MLCFGHLESRRAEGRASKMADMSVSAPRVSVGMPVYNGERFLGEALDSLLSQTFKDFELVISDNASTDTTEEICREYARRDSRIRYFRSEENQGAAWNFNQVFALSSGAYFKWFAHDDVLAPSYLERCVELLDSSDPSVVLVYPQRIVMTNDGRVLGPDKRVHWFESAPPYGGVGFFRSLYIPDRRIPALAFGLTRSDALRKTGLIGAFNLADLVLATELRLIGEFAYVPEPLFFNRGHDETSEFKKARRTAQGEAAWYDPKSRQRMVAPELRILIERMRAVLHAQVPMRRKLVHLSSVLFAHGTMRPLARLAPAADRAHSRLWQLWADVTLSAVRKPRAGLWGHRLWILAAGLRRGNRKQLRLAVSRNNTENRALMLEFVDARLGRRKGSNVLTRDVRDAQRVPEDPIRPEPHEARASDALEGPNLSGDTAGGSDHSKIPRSIGE